MKKLIILCTLLLTFSLQVFAADDNDLVLIYRVSDKDKNQIYNLFVKKTIVAKKTNNEARNYHVTVGWIRDVGKAPKLRKFMKDEAKSKEQFLFYFKEAGILRVAPTCPLPNEPKNPLNTKCNRNAVVLFPADDSLVVLKMINQELNEALDRFNELNNTKYKMDVDLQPQYFSPHITLADTGQIQQADRQKALTEVNNKMKDNNSFISVIFNKK